MEKMNHFFPTKAFQLMHSEEYWEQKISTGTQPQHIVMSAELGKV